MALVLYNSFPEVSKTIKSISIGVASVPKLKNVTRAFNLRLLSISGSSIKNSMSKSWEGAVGSSSPGGIGGTNPIGAKVGVGVGFGVAVAVDVVVVEELLPDVDVGVARRVHCFQSVVTLQLAQSKLMRPTVLPAVPAMPVNFPDELMVTPEKVIHPKPEDHAFPPKVPVQVLVTPPLVGLRFIQP